jgi:hypothetical protein
LHVAETSGEYRVQEEAETLGEVATPAILRVLRPLAQLQQAVILADAPMSGSSMNTCDSAILAWHNVRTMQMKKMHG